MKYCMHCGQNLPDEARFCDFCGAAIPHTAPEPAPMPEPVKTASPQDEHQEECECLSNLRKNLRGEYLSWKISTWVLFGFTIVYVLFMIFFLVLFNTVPGAVSGGDRIFFNAFFSTFIIYFSILMVPNIVMGFVMASKSKKYMLNIYERPEEAIERCGHVGTIVLAAIFNSIALIFVIINFVRCKTRGKVFDRIVRKRRGG